MSYLLPCGAHEVWMRHRNRYGIDSNTAVHAHPFTTVRAGSTGADLTLTWKDASTFRTTQGCIECVHFFSMLTAKSMRERIGRWHEPWMRSLSMDQPKPVQPSDSLPRPGKIIDGAWADCPKTMVPRHMKANLRARFNTKASQSVAYEARSVRFFYRANRGPSSACNKENPTIQIQRNVESGPSNSFACRRNEPIRGLIRGLAHP